MSLADLLAVQGIPQTRLRSSDVEQLPAEAPPAPWHGTARAVLWVARPTRAAADAAGAVGRTGRIAAVVGGLLDYEDTPVGPYRELIGGIGLLSRRGLTATVPFIAVDSPTSVVGGRANWSLPKTLAHFEGVPSGEMTATGDGWSVRASVTTLGPPLPWRAPFRLQQQWPDGSIRCATFALSGRARPALVRVRVEGDASLSGWLRSGRYLGMVVDPAAGTIGPMPA